jgi:hypothetical protein
LWNFIGAVVVDLSKKNIPLAVSMSFLKSVSLRSCSTLNPQFSKTTPL